MDVDLLRPGTVPISPDTVLWFEFLLDHSLLLKHLQKPKPDPSPTELIIKFTMSILESMKNDVMKAENNILQQNNECCIIDPEAKPKNSLKNMALKILSLKVAAYIKWDLNVLTTLLPFKIQVHLMQDLLYFTNDNRTVEILNAKDENCENSEAQTFALTLYHRWIITCIQMQRMSGGDTENVTTYTEETVTSSINFLLDISKKETPPPRLLTYNCFMMLSESNQNVKLDMSQSKLVSQSEFNVQIFYNIATFYFFQEKYEMAKSYFMQCVDCLGHTNASDLLDKDALDGYLKACNVINSNVTDSKGTEHLLQQFHISLIDNYMGLITILQKDNNLKQIPYVYRANLELDIQGATHSGGKFTVARDLLPRVQALNIIRQMLDGVPVASTVPSSHMSPKLIDMIEWGCQHLSNEQDKVIIRKQILYLCITEGQEDVLEKGILKDVQSSEDLHFVDSLCDTENIKLPDLVKGDAKWSVPEFKNRRLEVRSLEQQIIWTYDPQQLRQQLTQLSSQSTGRPLWRLNPRWELPIPLQSVLMSLPRGNLQNLGYALLAKAKELQQGCRWDEAQQLLKTLEADAVQSGLGKLARLVNWELLLVKLCRVLAEWGTVTQEDKQILVLECKNCLQVLQTGQNGSSTEQAVLPRTEIMEHCVLCLLNFAEWEFIVSLEKRWSFMEMSAGIAYACIDLLKFKGSKRVSRDIWDLVLPMFAPNASQGSNKQGVGNGNQSNMLQAFLEFSLRLREATAVGIVISMLTKLYNILRDEVTLELTIENGQIWPLVISNANSYNIKGVMECLRHLTQHALSHYPTNLLWLHLMADISFVQSYHESALKYYLQSLLVQTEYLNVPVPRDDHVFKRMIKCALALGCHTQAAVLCQFLEEPDYVLAFRSLSESKSSCDAMDGYYRCFWDPSILEYLVHLHHKKGEQQRRQRAVQALGLLELNANNNEEIRREAANVRKIGFLRALAKQYV